MNHYTDNKSKYESRKKKKELEHQIGDRMTSAEFGKKAGPERSDEFRDVNL